jgi:hypothetical protein
MIAIEAVAGRARAEMAEAEGRQSDAAWGPTRMAREAPKP